MPFLMKVILIGIGIFVVVFLATIVFSSTGKVIINYYFKKKKEEMHEFDRLQGEIKTKTKTGV